MTRACAAKVRFPDRDHACSRYVPPAYDTTPVEPTPPAARPADGASAGGRGSLPATGSAQAIAVAAVALLLGLALRAARADA